MIGGFSGGRFLFGPFHDSWFSDDSFGCLNDGAHSNPIVIDEFFRFSTMRDFTNGEFKDFHAFRCDSAKNGIAQTSMGVVILNREDSTLRCTTALQQAISIDGDDAVKIDYTDGNAR